MQWVSVKPGLWTGLDWTMDWTGLWTGLDWPKQLYTCRQQTYVGPI